MKVLLANKFFYPRGGDCVYTIELEKLLRSRGHETAVFAMDHPDTLDTPWRSYFPRQVVFLPLRVSGMMDCIARPLGSIEVRARFDRLLDDFQPDVVHLNNIHSQLSPVIARQACRRGLPVFWTLHDYKLLCPRYDCMLHGKTVCDLCFTDKRHVIRHRCVKNSLGASVLAYLEAVRWSRARLQAYTKRFLCPSAYLRSRMVQGGWREEQLVVLPNFVDGARLDGPIATERAGYYCYVGRLSEEKGVRTLIQAAGRLPYPLKLVGDGPLLDGLRAKPPPPHIEVLGRMNWEELKPLLAQARFSVMPSECCENNPLSLIESLGLGTPVLGADIGGIPEMIDAGTNGRLFRSGCAEDLMAAIAALFQSPPPDYIAIAPAARQRYSSESHYKALMALYA